MYEELKRRVLDANLELPRLGLVTWTSGNVSARDAETGLVAIKPSGLRYSDMIADDIVVVDLDGHVVDGSRGPSSDTSSHLGIYRRRDDVRSVIHTHSPYATAWAAIGEPIPCALTAIADEFGGDVPLGAYARIGGDEIGEEVVRSIGISPAIIMRSHGVFTIGPTIEKALQAAVMVEDIAKTMSIARTIGTPTRLSDEEIESNAVRYRTRYGTPAASTGVQTP